MERAITQIVVLVVGQLALAALGKWLPAAAVVPDMLPLFVFYIGFRGQKSLVGVLAMSVSAGYLMELLLSYPKGTASLAAVVVALLGFAYGKKFVLREFWVTSILSAVVSFVYCLLLGVGISVANGVAAFLPSSGVLFMYALFCFVFGPMVFRILKHVDSLFARTMRERLSILEGH